VLEVKLQGTQFEISGRQLEIWFQRLGSKSEKQKDLRFIGIKMIVEAVKWRSPSRKKIKESEIKIYNKSYKRANVKNSEVR
jgi:hypothetical protein